MPDARKVPSTDAVAPLSSNPETCSHAASAHQSCAFFTNLFPADDAAADGGRGDDAATEGDARRLPGARTRSTRQRFRPPALPLGVPHQRRAQLGLVQHL